MNVDKDAFSQGQIFSKIWLCEELEKVNLFKNPSIWVLGGWQGLLSFLLLSRRNLNIKNIKSYDVDPNCESIADAVNNSWLVDNWKFKAYTQDCNLLEYKEGPDIVINTSTEHFDKLDWFNNIPKGKLVCLQGNDLNHEDHYSNFKSLEDFSSYFKLNVVLFKGEKTFTYPNFSFTRYMIIGIK